jgi:hypothetical protein
MLYLRKSAAHKLESNMKSPMLKLIFSLIACLCMVCIIPLYAMSPAPAALLAAPASSNAQKMIWTGRSGGFVFEWSASDITARSPQSPARVLFSAKSLAQKEFAAFREASKDPDTGKMEKCSYERTFTVLAVVGSILSFSDGDFTVCERAAHPGGELRYTTIDLAKPGGVGYKELEMEVDLAQPGKAVKLTDLFDERDIFNALMADTVVKEALGTSGSRPRTLAELVEAFAAGASATDKLCYSVSEDIWTRFVFHHLENGKVAIRLGLPGAGPCRYNLTEIGILLPIPASLKTALAQAAAGKEGFLMKDQKKISRGQTTSFSFETTKLTRR